MDARKLIKFGNSSHVVSVPGSWIKKNNLNKGDLVYLEENGNNELVLSPQKKMRIKEDKSITINTEGSDIEKLNREIISAYLNNYRTIRLKGKNLHAFAGDLKNRIQNLMGLEIIDQNNELLVSKDLLDLNEVSLLDILKRMDLITRAILSDLINDVRKINVADLKLRDENVNRLYFVALRTIRSALDYPDLREKLGLTNGDLLNIWHIIHHIETIADEVKILGGYLKKTKSPSKDVNEFLEIFKDINKAYINTMKAIYKKDKDDAYVLSSFRDKVLEKINRCCKSSSCDICVSYERLKNIAGEVHKIGRRVYS